MRTAVGNTTVKYLEAHPDWPSRTLARLMLRENPKLFHSLDHARRSVMNYRVGAVARGKCNPLAGGKFVRPHGHQRDGYIPLPAPLPEKDPWQVVPVTFRKAVLLYDVHIPFHDEANCQTAIRYARDEVGPDCIVLAGDLMDFYSLSFWERDPNRRDTLAELQMGERFIEVLRETFPKAQIILQEGNHEERLPRYLWQSCPELGNLEELKLANLLHCADYNVRVVTGKKPLLAGKHLHILHGHEFGGFMTNPVNPARGLFLRGKVNAICGHFHQTSHHTEPGLGRPVSTWSSGALCNLKPAYRPINKWDAGFASVDMTRENWSVRTHKIIRGQVV